jgi:hypothetical protein
VPKYQFTVHSAVGPLYPEGGPKELDNILDAAKHAEAIAERPFVSLDGEAGQGAFIPTEGIIAVTFYDAEKAEEERNRIKIVH